jgi:DNA-binding transcriptional LysR family regulator
MPWVVSYNNATAFTPAVQQLRTIGIEPDIRVVVESFLALPFLVADTDRVALVQGRLATRLGEAAGVRVLPCPCGRKPSGGTRPCTAIQPARGCAPPQGRQCASGRACPVGHKRFRDSRDRRSHRSCEAGWIRQVGKVVHSR